MAADRRRLRFAGLRWPAHRVAGISRGSRSRRQRNALCARIAGCADPDCRPCRVRGTHRRCDLVPGRKRRGVAGRRRDASSASARSPARGRNASCLAAARLGSGRRRDAPSARLRAGSSLQLRAPKRGCRRPSVAACRATCRRAATFERRVGRSSRFLPRSPSPSTTRANFPSLPATHRAEPAFSPRSRSAPSRPSPRLVSARRIGSPPKPALLPRSAASSSTPCCTPFGQARLTASAHTRNSSR